MEQVNKKNQVYNLIILDRSGSMSSIAQAAVSGLNETVGGIRAAQQQFAQTQQHYVSLLTFCSCRIEYVYDCVPVERVENLTLRQYQPCCGTPLYDAMGHGINDLHKKTKENPNASVVVTIITDGMENASKEYGGKAIKALVDRMREQFGWNFAYIGTNQDVESVAMSLSITNTMYFEDTDEGMADAWKRERRAKLRMFSRMDDVNCYMANAEPSMRAERMRETTASNRNYMEHGEISYRVTPAQIACLKPGQVFVFGSNAKGLHNGGAAGYAVAHFGATVGQPSGLQGQSYAIVSTEGLDELRHQIDEFIAFARRHRELTFFVTAIGCGNAGLKPRDVAPLFVKAIDTPNICLPEEFWDELI